MPRHKTEDGFRSGRFKTQAGSTLPIIRSESGSTVAYYRIHNVADEPFSVQVGSGTAMPVGKNCSLDLTVAAGAIVNVIAGSGGPAWGVYDILRNGQNVRSGHFKAEAGGSAFTIIQSPGQYRIFNGSDADLSIGGLTVPKNCSLDIDVSALLDIPAGEAQGAYDLLEPRTNVRSGRFRIKMPNMNPTAQTIIQTTGSGIRRYRLTNSGEKDIIVNVPDGTTGSTTKTIRKDQSFDFVTSTSANSSITVVGAARHLIEGVYDYLGPAN